MSAFFAEFAAYVEIVLLSNEELLIPGDYNIHIDVAGDSDANTLSDFFESVGLRQHVEKHTHVQGHTLDLVISRRSDNIIFLLSYYIIIISPPKISILFF